MSTTTATVTVKIVFVVIKNMPGLRNLRKSLFKLVYYLKHTFAFVRLTKLIFLTFGYWNFKLNFERLRDWVHFR